MFPNHRYTQFDSENGFTLIELLVVVAIIGVLSGVVLSSLSGARESAQVTATVQDLRQMEKAFRRYAIENQINGFYDEQRFGEGGNPDIEELVENTEFSRYLQTAPVPRFGNDKTYVYDNDNPNSTGEYGKGDSGIMLNSNPQIPTSILESIDKQIDGDIDLNCGKFREYNSNNNDLYYNLSFLD